MNTHSLRTWFPKLLLGLSLYALATSTSHAQVVNCPGDSISATVAAAPPGPVFITINGICIESFAIDRDNVHLLNGVGGGVTGPGPNFIAIVVAAQRVVISNLTISGGAAAGIVVTDNASVDILNSTIQSNANTGVAVLRGAFARLVNNTISGNGSVVPSSEVTVTDSGTARLEGNFIVSTLADRNVGAGVGIFRDAFVRMRGGNSITNTTVTGAAIQAFHGSTFRQDGGVDTVSGNVEVGNGSNMEFRDAAITGNASAFHNSVLRLRNSSVTGEVFVNETNVLSVASGFGPLVVNGTVHCDGGTLFGSANVVATAIDCPAPVHVLRADNTARILVEETAPNVTQQLFTLQNNGDVGFGMVNTNTAQEWRFRAAADGFRVSLGGTGGPEMTVLATGAVTMGPGGAANFDLDSSGNLTLAGTLTELSDVRAKENITAVDGQALLARLTDLPIATWTYKADATKSVHLGPMAQDFHAAFGLGADDKHLAPKDLASVALVGVKELHKRLAVREAEIVEHAAKLAEREAELAALKQRLAALEEMVRRTMAQQVGQTAQR
jgi:hypothetical protein